MPSWKFFDELFESEKPKGFREEKPIPLQALWKKMEALSCAIDEKKWHEVQLLAFSSIELLKLALDKKTCNTGTPHLDGVYQFGMMRLSEAPTSAQGAVESLNRQIKKWRSSL